MCNKSCLFLLLSGLFLLFLGMNINNWLVFTEDPNLTFLTLMFFCLNFLAATQDIAVDGWALTMLRKLVLFCTILLYNFFFISN